jgi:hypothetical protein
VDGMLAHHRLASQLRLVPIYTPGWREANGVKCIDQGHLETEWVLGGSEPTTFWLWVPNHFSNDSRKDNTETFAQKEKIYPPVSLLFIILSVTCPNTVSDLPRPHNMLPVDRLVTEIH